VADLTQYGVGIVRDANGDSHREQTTVFNPEDLDSQIEMIMDVCDGLSQKQTIEYVLSLKKESLDERFSFFIAWLISDKNPILRFWAAAFAFGLEITEGISQSEKANELKVTRAAISKRVKQFESEFGCISRNMKSQSACKSYQDDKKTNHHRYQKQIESAKNEYRNGSH
jgi:hypothetical protein